MSLQEHIVEEKTNACPAWVAAEVRNLRLKFAGEPGFVFKDFSLSIYTGEKVLLLGPSGCGKSTLLQVFSGLIPGVIEVPMKWEAGIIPKSWGFVFQDPDTQFCMPYADEELAFVLENLGIPREEMPACMDDALEKVGLSLPDRHVPIASLSQGMKQRLALASVLLMDPEVLLLDEPSALLDPIGREQIWQAVRHSSEGRTVVIVEHRIEEVLDYVDRVILLGPEGRILGQGKPEEIFARYRQELQEYGIWYPGVWEDYARSVRGRQQLSPAPVEAAAAESQPGPSSRLELAEFRGFRGDREAIAVEKAEAAPGDFIAVMGPNGAGKSTLLSSLMGLLTSEGVYSLDGQPAGKSQKGGRRSLRKRQVERTMEKLGFVFQNPEFQFVAETVEAETGFSLQEKGMPPAESALLVQRCLERFGLSSLGHRHPYQLSMGQKRRLSVATAMVVSKPVLLLDEPTFGQDAVNTIAILELCEKLRRQGTIIIMVTHEEHIARLWATEVWELRQGRVVKQVTTDRGRVLKRQIAAYREELH
ncbi:ABC transporter [Paenibacillus sp. CAA11]|uniref:ABC transporter ATP-binding protein n=1 Tax=Paenibacillus sp. CAA11 TaxID=1532905 RepID=UPI000D38441C|nr:ATP-binding cassette domain-containing protein [Paenibacillus sp. CAA11]AWB45832.1 ABC transporter [Paenibacillus sp. CAA11]